MAGGGGILRTNRYLTGTINKVMTIQNTRLSPVTKHYSIMAFVQLRRANLY